MVKYYPVKVKDVGSSPTLTATNSRFTSVCVHHGETQFTRDKHDNHKRCLKCRSEAVQRRRDKLKILAVNYKGGKCSKCGYDECMGALEFHHLDPSKKDFGLSVRGITRSWDKIKKELDKCILVCANCHREIHYAERTKTS